MAALSNKQLPNQSPNDWTSMHHHYCYRLQLQRSSSQPKQPKQPQHRQQIALQSHNTEQTGRVEAARQLQLQSNTLRSFLLLIIVYALSCLQPTLAAPRSSCILCDNNDRYVSEPNTKNYEEFLFEHQVSRQDAINALRLFNESDIGGSTAENSCKYITCTTQLMKYCLGPQFINDHCWCEMGHSEEGLPFVPHICYVGEKIHKPAAGSCFFYEEAKECCCAAPLAKQWRHISAADVVKTGMKFRLGAFMCISTVLLWHRYFLAFQTY